MRKNDALIQKLLEKQERLKKRSRFYLRLFNNWPIFIIGFLFLYVSLPIAAPVMMQVGASGPAETLYTIYSPMCHQFAFRSVFLFGEQTFYPRAEAGWEQSGSFEEWAADSDEFVSLYTERRQREDPDYTFNQADLQEWTADLQFAARDFRGDETMGYKIALCQRDIAIYGAMVIGGIAFLFVRKRLRPAPLGLWLLLGIAPMAIDGFSQLFGYTSAWEARETIPTFRLLTGTLFGLMNVWLAFPYLQTGMDQNRQHLEAQIDLIDDNIERLENGDTEAIKAMMEMENTTRE